MINTIQSSLADYIADNQYRYYYTTLSDEMQNVYNKLLDGYMDHKNSITVAVENIDEVWCVHRSICYDIPELFFIKAVKASFNPLLSTATIYPVYRFDHETCLGILRQMEKQTQVFIQRITMLPEREKVKQIHDHIIRNVTYKDLEAAYSHESPGVILYGIAVCEGIAKAFKYLSDRLGINSIVVTGDAIDEKQQTGTTGHAWNIVYIDSCSYHIDVTFDYSMSSRSVIRYDYYLLSDLQIKKDHLFDGTPTCRNNHEFYKTNGYYVESKTALQNLVRNELRPGKPLVIQVPNFREKPDSIAKNLLNIVSQSVPISCSLQSTVSMSYNSFRMIFQFELRQ